MLNWSKRRRFTGFDMAIVLVSSSSLSNYTVSVGVTFGSWNVYEGCELDLHRVSRIDEIGFDVLYRNLNS